MVWRNHGFDFEMELQAIFDWTNCLKEGYTIILVNNYYNGVRK